MTEPEWPLLPTGSASAPTPEADRPGATSPTAEAPAGGPTCPDCGRPVDPAAWFCEACGNPLVPTAAPPPPAATPGPDAPSTQTRRLGVRASQVVTCPSCGGTVGADGYCQTCGAKAPSPRDHYAEAPAAWVGGVCDRGIQHHRNEDAMALWASDDRAVLVVCDGVSTSVDSDVASQAAAQRARDVLVASAGDRTLGDEQWAQAMVQAVTEANRAVVETTAPESTNAASATFAAAVVHGDRVHYANLGDSRVYVVGAAGNALLSVDDSMAQAFIAEGMSRAEAESLPRAHAITKWLGRDAVDLEPRTGTFRSGGPGWLVVCSDGLWNYASAPDDLAAQVEAATAAGSDPAAVAQRLVEWANARGGQDNITVALARIPAPHPVPGPEPITLEAAPGDPEKES